MAGEHQGSAMELRLSPLQNLRHDPSAHAADGHAIHLFTQCVKSVSHLEIRPILQMMDGKQPFGFGQGIGADIRHKHAAALIMGQ